MDVAALEGLACATYKRLDLDPSRSVSTFTIARKLLGAESVQRPRMMIGAPAMTGVADGRRYIAVKASIPMPYARFFAGHELAHVLLEEEGYAGDDVEACCDYLGAALMAPRPAAFAMVRAFGVAPAEIADVVGSTQTWAALRVGEVLGIPLVVITPHRLYVRGPESFMWGRDEREVRRDASARKLRPGIARTRLTDDPRRVMLVADGLEDVG